MRLNLKYFALIVTQLCSFNSFSQQLNSSLPPCVAYSPNASFDAQKEIPVLYHGVLKVGSSEIPNGVYFCNLTSNNELINKQIKLVVIK